MPAIFMRVTVGDFEKFKQVVDSHESERQSFGITACTVYRDAGEDGAVTVHLNATDPGRAQEFLASEEIQAAFMEATVQGMPDVWFAEPAE